MSEQDPCDKNYPRSWGDDIALRGPDAPRNDGSLKHLIEYLLTVYERFGNTHVTESISLQWGATALHKQDEQKKRIAELEASLSASGATFQSRVAPFMEHCFGPEISADIVERYHRFIEESLELAQSLGCSAQDAHILVDYVFNRPVGQPHQEAGGVMVTLAALCLAAGMDMHAAGEDELHRVWGKIDVIREKQKKKPKGSPLPEYAERVALLSATGTTFDLITAEVEKARAKHPSWPANDTLFAAAIVAEESGELMRAAVQHKGEGGSLEACDKEAIQTAAVAIRFLERR